MKMNMPNIKEGKLSKCGNFLWFEAQETLNLAEGTRVRLEVPPLRLADHEGLLEAWTKLTGA